MSKFQLEINGWVSKIYGVQNLGQPICPNLFLKAVFYLFLATDSDGMSGTPENDATQTYRRIQIVDKDGEIEVVSLIADNTTPRWAQNVAQDTWRWSPDRDSNTPFFCSPVPFVIAPLEKSGEPFYSHNHCPSITWLNNGDLLAIWYSANREDGTELTILASRKRMGSQQWDAASEFFKVEKCNMHTPSIFRDENEVLYHINGVGPQGQPGWSKLALLMRSKHDNGVTWSRPCTIRPRYVQRHQPIAGAFVSRNALFVQVCDAVPGANGGTALFLSWDRGKNWLDPGRERLITNLRQDAVGEGTIAGIHAGVVELNDGRLMALGRGDGINGHMPMSISNNKGKTWTYSASMFPPIGGGQRLVLKRLQEGPILLVSFANPNRNDTRTGWTFVDSNEKPFEGIGLYAVLSYDEGQIWSVRKLLTPGAGTFDGGVWTGVFTASPQRAEHAGYLALTQTPAGIIHLFSSRLYYCFNLAWLNEPHLEANRTVMN